MAGTRSRENSLRADFSLDDRVLILGGAFAFGLATAHKLADRGMSICVVHRDRRGARPARLCTPEASRVNGEVIRVDGGEHLSGAIR